MRGSRIHNFCWRRLETLPNAHSWNSLWLSLCCENSTQSLFDQKYMWGHNSQSPSPFQADLEDSSSGVPSRIIALRCRLLELLDQRKRFVSCNRDLTGRSLAQCRDPILGIRISQAAWLTISSGEEQLHAKISTSKNTLRIQYGIDYM